MIGENQWHLGYGYSWKNLQGKNVGGSWVGWWHFLNEMRENMGRSMISLLCPIPNDFIIVLQSYTVALFMPHILAFHTPLLPVTSD